MNDARIKNAKKYITIAKRFNLPPLIIRLLSHLPLFVIRHKERILKNIFMISVQTWSLSNNSSKSKAYKKYNFGANPIAEELASIH